MPADNDDEDDDEEEEEEEEEAQQRSGLRRRFSARRSRDAAGEEPPPTPPENAVLDDASRGASSSGNAQRRTHSSANDDADGAALRPEEAVQDYVSYVQDRTALLARVMGQILPPGNEDVAEGLQRVANDEHGGLMTADRTAALLARAMVEILPPGDDDGDGDRVALGNQIEEEEEEEAREELPVGAVESDFDVQRAVRVQNYADVDERDIEREEEGNEEMDDENVRQWMRFDELISRVKLRRNIAFGFEDESDEEECTEENEATTSGVWADPKKTKEVRKLTVPKNWRMSADGSAVPAEHRRGLRSILIPGRVWFGSIWIPGSDKKSRYTFRVLFWDEERERLVCTHSAQGDEQTFYLHVEEHDDDDDRNKEEDRLNISFRDNETLCDGQIFPNGIIRGKVRQMIRGSEGHYEPANDTQNLFELKIAKWTPNAEDTVEEFMNELIEDSKIKIDQENEQGSKLPIDQEDERYKARMIPLLQNRKLRDYHLQRKRWALSRDILPSIKDAMLYAKNLPPKYEYHKRQMMGVLVSSTRLLSFPKDSVCLKSDEEEIAKCQDNSLGGHVYYDELEIEPGSLEDEPEIRTMMMLHPHFYRSHFVEYRHDDRAKTSIERRAELEKNSDMELEQLHVDWEIQWHQLWEIAMSETELLSASLRETAMELQNKIFATPREKLIDLSKRRRLKHKAHADMSDKISTLTTLIWRLIMLDPVGSDEKLRLAVRTGIFAENVMENRMMLAYKLLEDSLHVYTNRVPLSELIVRVTSFQKSDLVTRNGRPVTPNTLQNACAICLVDFEQGDRVLTLDCNHFFHENCAKEWLFKSSASCPNCRKIVNDGCANYLMSLSKEERDKLLLIVGDDFVRENFPEEKDQRRPSGLASTEHDEKDEEDDEYDRTQREMRELQQVSEAERGEEANDAVDRYL